METITAEAGLQEAEQLVQDVASAVAPGAAVTDSTTKAGPDPCTAPQTGKVYYTIFKRFDAPDGATGASAQSAVTAALSAQGLRLDAPSESGGWPTLTARTDYVGVRAMLSPDTPEVRIIVDTRCGTP